MSLGRRLGLIGCGRIGSHLVAACRSGQLPGWELVGVLVRHPRSPEDDCFTTDPEALWQRRPDLIVECAGPEVLRMFGAAALRAADTWTISASALADPHLLSELETVGRESGHRLRVMSGAIAGLDGLSAITAGGKAQLTLRIDVPPGPGPAATLFSGQVRQAARLFPNQVNVAVAAALAGPGLDDSHIEVRHPGPVARHTLQWSATGRTGTLRVAIEPDLSQGLHPVSVAIIAALRQADQVVWVG